MNGVRKIKGLWKELVCNKLNFPFVFVTSVGLAFVLLAYASCSYDLVPCTMTDTY